MANKKPTKDEACFMCLGTGTIRYSSIEVGAGFGGGNVERLCQMPCYKCEATGRLPIGNQAAWDKAKLDWCSCKPDEERGAGEFHDDGQCVIEYKHHWHCPVCGKLQQVG